MAVTTAIVRTNLIEQLNSDAAKLSSKESPVSKGWSIESGDIPGSFHRMYDIANALASRDGLVWLHTRYTPEEILRIRKKDLYRNREDEQQQQQPITPEMELLNFVNEKQEDYMKRMTRLLELYIASRWGTKEDKK